MNEEQIIKLSEWIAKQKQLVGVVGMHDSKIGFEMSNTVLDELYNFLKAPSQFRHIYINL